MKRTLLASAIAAALLTFSFLPAGCNQSDSTPAAKKLTGTGAADYCCMPTSAPATQAAAGNWSAETYRQVEKKDEIVTVLDNGMVVIAKRVASPAVSVRCYARTGGVYEGRWLGGGLSHLLEHLVAGGSSIKRTEAENRDLLQDLGNDSNAYTTTDHTAFFVNTTADKMEQAVDLVAGWMLGAKITPAEYAREYEVVQRELEMGKGEPDKVYYELIQHNRYKVSPGRVPVIGYQEVIRSLSRDDVYSYYKLAYQPNNMVFAVAGDVDPEKVIEAVKKNCGGVPPGREFDHRIEPEPAITSPRTVVATFPKLGQARLNISFPSVRLDSTDLYALDLLSTALGGGESSLLVQELRDDKQLVSNISASDETPNYEAGTFSVDMELEPAKIPAATDAVLAALEKVKKEGVADERLARAKVQMRAARVKSLLTAEDIASSYATDYLHTGDIHFGDVYVDRMQKITNEQIKRVASKYFDKNRLLTTALIPSEQASGKDLPKAVDLLRSTASPTTQPGKEQPASNIARVDLGNDTVLLTRRISTSPTVVIQLYSLGGLTAEDAKTNGLGNLTMETAVRGTKTRSAKDIAEFFDSIGGDLATASGNNSWSWTATCLKDDFAKAIEVYADVVNNPIFPDDEVSAMKKRIAAAIAAQDSDWHQQATRFFKKTYFGPLNSPYQFMAAGTEQGVGAFTPEQVRDWYGKTILSQKKVLAIFGDVDQAQAEKLAKQYFGGKDAGNLKASAGSVSSFKTQSIGAPGKASIQVERVELNKTEQALAGVVIGFRADGVIGDPANFPIDVADAMCSGYTYPTGYLHETLRGEGLVYVVHAQNVPGRNQKLPGTFIVYAGCDPKNVNRVVDLILLNIARLQGNDEAMNVDWYKRSKEMIVVADALAAETPAAQATQAALDELMGLGYDWHKGFADKIRGVGLPDVRAISAARLKSCVVTVSTPNPELVTTKAGKREYEKFEPVDLTPRGVQHDSK